MHETSGFKSLNILKSMRMVEKKSSPPSACLGIYVTTLFDFYFDCFGFCFFGFRKFEIQNTFLPGKCDY